MSGFSSPVRLGLALLLLAGGLSVAVLGVRGLSRWLEQNGVKSSAKEEATQPSIPAIDAATVERTETATFALG